jgi:hypothetical protein
MKKLMMIGLIGASVVAVPSLASAGERLGDALMGGLAGGLVAGPVGLVAGGAIGYTAGPNISRGMGIHHRHYRHSRAYRRHHYADRSH